MGDIGFSEMLVIVLVIVVLFGPDKLPQIARDLGQGVRKMRGAMEDVKTEILKETDNPVAEIKREIDKVKEAARDFNPLNEANLKKAETPQPTAEAPAIKPADDEDYAGPVSR